jgi:hypothetical protein
MHGVVKERHKTPTMPRCVVLRIFSPATTCLVSLAAVRIFLRHVSLPNVLVAALEGFRSHDLTRVVSCDSRRLPQHPLLDGMFMTPSVVLSRAGLHRPKHSSGSRASRTGKTRIYWEPSTCSPRFESSSDRSCLFGQGEFPSDVC